MKNERVLLLCSLLAMSCASGGVSQAVKQDLQLTVANAHGPLELCYKQALDANAALGGEVVLKFEVDKGTKKLARVKVEKTTLNEPELEKCVVQETSELTLSKPPEAKLVVTYPVRFKKTEE